MAKVYLISTHDEYGAENVAATLDKDRVVEVFLLHASAYADSWIRRNVDKTTFPTQRYKTAEEYIEAVKAASEEENKEDAEALKKILETGSPDAESGTSLRNGWGGWQLHVVDLQ